MVLVDPDPVNQKVSGEIAAHPVRHGALSVPPSTVEFIACTALGTGRGKTPCAADASVQNEIPAHYT